MPRQSQWCEVCWEEVANFPAALEQHRRFNLNCIQWQCYEAARGRITWDEAQAEAVATKQNREAQAVREQAGHASAGGKTIPAARGHKEKRDRSVAVPVEAEREVDVTLEERPARYKKKKKDKKKRKEPDPSPEVDRSRRRRRRPSTDSDEGDGADKKKRRHHRRQLVIKLPNNLRF